MPPTRPGVSDYGLLLLLAAIWGGSFLFIKIAVATIPAATVTLSRLVIASVLLIAVARLAGQSLNWSSRLWVSLGMAAIFGNALPFTLISWGEEVIDSGIAAILMAVMPLSTLLLAHLFTGDEKLNLAKLAGVAFGIAGLVALIGVDQLATLGDDTWRQLAVAGAAFCYGVNAVVTKSLMAQPRRALAAWIMSLSAIIMIPFALYFDRPWTLDPSQDSVIATLVLSVVHTAIGTLLMFAIIRRRGASFFSQINFLIPVIGVIYGVLLLSEQLTENAYLALALILAGVAIARGSFAGRSPKNIKAGP